MSRGRGPDSSECCFLRAEVAAPPAALHLSTGISCQASVPGPCESQVGDRRSLRSTQDRWMRTEGRGGHVCPRVGAVKKAEPGKGARAEARGGKGECSWAL